jgi:hypothetical protein
VNQTIKIYKIDDFLKEEKSKSPDNINKLGCDIYKEFNLDFQNIFFDRRI